MKLLLAVILALTLTTAHAEDIEVITFVRWGNLVAHLTSVEVPGCEPESPIYFAFMATDLLYDLSRNNGASRDRIDYYFASEKTGKWSRKGDNIILYDLQDTVELTFIANQEEQRPGNRPFLSTPAVLNLQREGAKVITLGVKVFV